MLLLSLCVCSPVHLCVWAYHISTMEITMLLPSAVEGEQFLGCCLATLRCCCCHTPGFSPFFTIPSSGGDLD